MSLNSGFRLGCCRVGGPCTVAAGSAALGTGRPFRQVPIENFDAVSVAFIVRMPMNDVRVTELKPPEEPEGAPVVVRVPPPRRFGGRSRRCCDPLSVQLQTNTCGVGDVLPQGTAVLFTVTNAAVGATFRVGCSEDGAGRWTYSGIPPGDPCLGSPPTDTWPALQTTNPLNRVLLFNTQNTVASAVFRRQLRAVPVLLGDDALDADAQEFYLEWRYPGAFDGSFPVTVAVGAPGGAPLPCGREVLIPSAASGILPGYQRVVAGPRGALGSSAI
jgi:hypothetical protein